MRAERIAQRLITRNEVFAACFAHEAPRLAELSHGMSERFLRGGRLIAFGRGAFATDAQHVAVEFVHPVIMGKRALPALDLSLAFEGALATVVAADDMVLGLMPFEGDPVIERALDMAIARGAMRIELPRETPDPFLHQELGEMAYHLLWETVHVFLEHQPMGADAGPAHFLYPFLGDAATAASGRSLVAEVATSMHTKVGDDALLRAEVAREQSEGIAELARALRGTLANGGRLILLGNGGSATDANDLLIDCVAPPAGLAPVDAISLSLDAATVSGIANDVGDELIFVRQLAAHARAGDGVLALSTSGSSRNVVAALADARRRGMLTAALLGGDGGEIARHRLADYRVIVRSEHVPRVQEVHASIYHVLREELGAREDGTPG